MEVYTLASDFTRNQLIQDFVSIIWTERYNDPGDITITTIPSVYNVDLLKPGTLLGRTDTKEVMVVSTQTIEDGNLKVTGRSLLDILKNRLVWNYNPDWCDQATLAKNVEEPAVEDFTTSAYTPGHFMSFVVDEWAIRCPQFPSCWTGWDLYWQYERIENLYLGSIDTSGSTTQLTARLGPIYEAIKPVADQHKIGMHLRLGTPPNMYFTTYRGRDLTKGNTVGYEPVIFSPSLDELQDVKEVRSNAQEKNMCYVPDLGYRTGGGLVKSSSTSVKNLDRKTGLVIPNDLPAITRWNTHNLPIQYAIARKYLGEHTLVHLADGQLSPNSRYKRGTEYDLGDLVDLVSPWGTSTTARVMEYVQTQDKHGERAYPTVAIET